MKRRGILFFITLTLVLTALILSAFFYYKSILRDEKKEASANLSTLSQLKVSQITNWRNERLSDAEFLESNFTFKEKIFQFINNPENREIKNQIIEWLKPIKHNHEYDDFILINKEFKTYPLFDKNYILNLQDSIYLKRASDQNEVLLGGLYLSPESDQISMGAYIPLSLPGTKGLFAFLKLKIDPALNLYPLIESIPTASSSSESFLVRRDGDSVTYLHNLRFKKNTALKFRLPLTLSTLPAVMAVLGKTGIVEGIDYKGTAVLADLNKIPHSPWFIISKINMDEVYAPVRKQAMYIFGGVLTLIMLCTLATYTLWRKKMEEALYKSEHRFRLFVSASNEALYLMSPDWSEMLHLKSGGFLASTEKPEMDWLQKYIHPDDQKYITAVIKESIENKKTFELEHKVKLENGTWGWTFSRAIPIMDKKGEIIEWFGAAADFTIRKKTEEDLKRSEEKFEKIFRNSPVAKAIVDGETYTTLDVNTAFEELYGYSREEVIGKTSRDLQLYINMEQREDVINQLRNNVPLKNIEIDIRRKNNEIRTVLISIEHVEIENKKCLLAVSQDITLRKQFEKSMLESEASLKRSEERFSTAFRMNPNALVISSFENGKILEVNETFLKLFKYSRDEVIGKTSVELGMFANPNDRSQAIKLLTENGSMYDFELVVKLKTGEHRIALLSAELLKTSSGHSFLTIIRDVTDEKNAETALSESEKKFRDLAESMPQVVWTARADGSVDYYSQQIRELEGITLNENGFWDWVPVLHEDDIQLTRDAWEYSVSTGSIYEIIHRIRKIDGEFKWFLSRAVPIKNENGEILKWYGTSTDISLQKDAEEKLKISENRFRELIETQLEMIIRLDTEGQFTFANEAFCRKFGVNREKLIGSTFVPLVYADDLPIAFEKIYEMENPPHRAAVEIREYTIEGLRWIEWFGTGIRNSEGKVIEFQAVGRDIHERKSAEEALTQRALELKESERKFRTLAENSPEVIARFDKELKHTFINKYGSIVYGIPQEEVIGKTSAELGMPPDKVEFWQRHFEEVFRTGKQQTVDFDFNSPNLGHQFFSSVFVPEFDDTGEVVSILAITRDITERKKLEEELVRSEEKIKRKLDSILLPEGDIAELELSDIIDSISIQNLMNDFYRISKIPMAIIDLKGKVLVGVGWQKICTDFHRMHPLTNNFCIESDVQLSQGAKSGEFKLYKCRNNMWDMASPVMIGGKHMGNLFIGQFYFENEVLDYELFRDQARKYGFNEEEYISALEAVPRLSEEQLSVGIEFFTKLSNMISQLSYSNIELARLLAERDTLTKSLRESQQDLTRSNKDLEAFAYSASHDLQEPIRMVKSYVQLFKMNYGKALDNSATEYLDFIHEGATRMQSLIIDLLKYSRISTQKHEFESVDCNKVIKELLSDLKFSIEEANAEIQVGELPVVKGITSQIRQLFQNFIQNSLKFRNEKPPVIIIDCEERDGSWLFSIKDNGIGIEEKYYERIFVIFQRLHDREKYPGTGIGLAMCKKIIERHGGKIFVDSKPGEGSTFYFTLPVLAIEH